MGTLKLSDSCEAEVIKNVDCEECGLTFNAHAVAHTGDTKLPGCLCPECVDDKS